MTCNKARRTSKIKF